jgi:hypothetical protein
VDDLTRANSRHGAADLFEDSASNTVDDLLRAVAGFQRSESWFTLQPIAFRPLGQYSFGLGVVYGIGESVISSVVELLQLARSVPSAGRAAGAAAAREAPVTPRQVRRPEPVAEEISTEFYLPGGAQQVWMRPDPVNISPPKPTNW